MQKSIKNEINKLRNNLYSTGLKMGVLSKLIKKFPDLEIKRNRWGHEFYESKSINHLCDKVEYGYTCGCCIDAGYLAKPYMEFDGMRIYASPYSKEIGECKFETYIEHDLNSRLDKWGLSDTLKEKIKKHSRAKVKEAEEYWEDENED